MQLQMLGHEGWWPRTIVGSEEVWWVLTAALPFKQTVDVGLEFKQGNDELSRGFMPQGIENTKVQLSLIVQMTKLLSMAIFESRFFLGTYACGSDVCKVCLSVRWGLSFKTGDCFIVVFAWTNKPLITFLAVLPLRMCRRYASFSESMKLDLAYIETSNCSLKEYSSVECCQ